MKWRSEPFTSCNYHNLSCNAQRRYPTVQCWWNQLYQTKTCWIKPNQLTQNNQSSKPAKPKKIKQKKGQAPLHNAKWSPWDLFVRGWEVILFSTRHISPYILLYHWIQYLFFFAGIVVRLSWIFILLRFPFQLWQNTFFFNLRIWARCLT